MLLSVPLLQLWQITVQFASFALLQIISYVCFQGTILFYEFCLRSEKCFTYGIWTVLQHWGIITCYKKKQKQCRLDLELGYWKISLPQNKWCNLRGTLITTGHSSFVGWKGHHGSHMSDLCHPFKTLLVNTVAIKGFSGQIHHKAEMVEGLHTTQQTYT